MFRPLNPKFPPFRVGHHAVEFAHMASRGLTYADAGVDIEAGDAAVERFAKAVRATHGPRVIGAYGAFAGMFRLDFNERLFRRNYRDPVLVACTDGVGTKVRLAIDLGVHHTVGIDCVAMNVNDMICQGAEPLFFLDYLGLHRQDPERTAELVAGVAEGCRLADCALLGGECAEMPDIYRKGDYDIAGFAVGVAELSRVVDAERVRPGDVILGLTSSGIHSNGYTLVRKIVEKAKIDLHAEHPRSDGQGRTFGRQLLEPTRIYVRSIGSMLRAYKVKRPVSGMAHITGGGLPGNLVRALPKGCRAVVSKSACEVPALFRVLQRAGRISEAEMWKVFNMGIGYCVIVRPTFAEGVTAKLEAAGETVRKIGVVRKGRTGVELTA